MGEHLDGSKSVSGGREQTRARVLSAALQLLDGGGSEAVTTRAVAELAGVQPPVIYRLFTDKDGLLTALAEHGFTLYLAQKQSNGSNESKGDPVEALRSGWDRHVAFGLAHPSLYLLMYAQPREGASPASELSLAILHRHMGKVAASDRLRIPQERAVALFHSAALGIVLTLLRSPREARDLAVSSIARDHTLAMIALTQDAHHDRSPVGLPVGLPVEPPVSVAAAMLHTAIQAEDGFSPAELALFKEWLGRIIGDRRKGLPSLS